MIVRLGLEGGTRTLTLTLTLTLEGGTRTLTLTLTLEGGTRTRLPGLGFGVGVGLEGVTMRANSIGSISAAFLRLLLSPSSIKSSRALSRNRLGFRLGLGLGLDMFVDTNIRVRVRVRVRVRRIF